MAFADVQLPPTDVREATLDNGLKILVRELHTTPLVSVWCWYRVGSGDEAPGLTGISHWVEHMNFKGTELIPRDRMKGIVEKFGGMYRAFQFGAPPHGGAAFGIDRIVMLLCGAQNLREVTLFPMNQQAEDLLMGAPSPASAKQLRELSIRLNVQS